MADFALQRRNMVESQVRPSDVTDRRVISAMLDVPREEFVPDALRQLAYMDGDVVLTAAAPGRPARSIMSRPSSDLPMLHVFTRSLALSSASK